MGTNGPGNPIFIALLLAVGASVLLAIIGFVLHGRGHFTTRGPALAWAILTIAPLFGAGGAMAVKHQYEMSTGKTPSGVNENGVQGAP